MQCLSYDTLTHGLETFLQLQTHILYIVRAENTYLSLNLKLLDPDTGFDVTLTPFLLILHHSLSYSDDKEHTVHSFPFLPRPTGAL